MSAVLFIVTIPTKAEEGRLKKLSMGKILEKINDDRAGTMMEHLENKNLKNEVMDDIADVQKASLLTTSTINNENSILEQDTLSERSNILAADEGNKNINEVQTDSVYRSQYDTFPKRKKSQQHQPQPLFAENLTPKCDDEKSSYTGSAKTEGGGGSLKDISIKVSLFHN